MAGPKAPRRSLRAVRSSLLLVCALSLAGVVRADVVVLEGGGSISGKVVSEDEEEIVLQTPEGRIALPRRRVVEVRRESQGKTTLSLARERVRAGAYAEAERLYRRAARDADPEVAEQAREGLERLATLRARSRRQRTPPRTPWPVPAGLDVRPLVGGSLQEQFDRARRAIETGRGPTARRLLEPLARAKPDDRVLRFLCGRARALAGDEAAAREAFAAASALSKRRLAALPLAAIVDHLRRELSGEPLSSRSPGVGPRWRRLADARFAVYHTRSTPPREVLAACARALHRVLEAFALPVREVDVLGPVVILLFEREDEARGNPVYGSSYGHAVARAAPDGTLWLLLATSDEGFLAEDLVHAVAHVVVGDRFGELPPWAREGAAAYASPARLRARWRAGGDPRAFDLETLFARGEGWGESRRARRLLRAEATAGFEVLAERLGLRGALKLARRLNGPSGKPALREAGIEPAEFARAVRARLGSSGG